MEISTLVLDSYGNIHAYLIYLWKYANWPQLVMKISTLALDRYGNIHTCLRQLRKYHACLRQLRKYQHWPQLDMEIFTLALACYKKKKNKHQHWPQLVMEISTFALDSFGYIHTCLRQLWKYPHWLCEYPHSPQLLWTYSHLQSYRIFICLSQLCKYILC